VGSRRELLRPQIDLRKNAGPGLHAAFGAHGFHPLNRLGTDMHVEAGIIYLHIQKVFNYPHHIQGCVSGRVGYIGSTKPGHRVDDGERLVHCEPDP
jgi:hypothetical protein